jgi:hypothetical protein
MSRCDDKRITRKLLAAAGLRVPAQQLAGDADRDAGSWRSTAGSWSSRRAASRAMASR